MGYVNGPKSPEEFYDRFTGVHRSMNGSDILILMGDFNTPLGSYIKGLKSR